MENNHQKAKQKKTELNKSLDKIDNEIKTEKEEPELKKNHLNMPIMSTKELQEKKDKKTDSDYKKINGEVRYNERH